MKLMMLSLAGVVTASAMTPVAADAQRWRDDRGWHSGRYYHGGRYYAPPRRFRGRGYGYDRRWRGPRFRTVCRYRPTPYGSVRRCYRVRF
jgi:hypothetical protein